MDVRGRLGELALTTSCAGIELVEHTRPFLRKVIDIPYEVLDTCWNDSNRFVL